jgi:hypothetical protein
LFIDPMFRAYLTAQLVTIVGRQQLSHSIGPRSSLIITEEMKKRTTVLGPLCCYTKASAKNLTWVVQEVLWTDAHWELTFVAQSLMNMTKPTQR